MYNSVHSVLYPVKEYYTTHIVNLSLYLHYLLHLNIIMMQMPLFLGIIKIYNLTEIQKATEVLYSDDLPAQRDH